MADLISLEEVAARLGVSTDEVAQLIERRKLFGVRADNELKFKLEDVDRLKSERDAAGGGISFDLPDAGEGESDVVLLSDKDLGSSPSGSSTVIGQSGAEVEPGSDIELESGDLGSDVTLAPDSGSDTGSDVRLVASDSPLPGGPGSDLELIDMDDDSEIPLEMDTGADDDATDADQTLQMPPGSDLTLDSDLSLVQDSDALAPAPGSDLTLDSSGLSLAPDSDALAPASGSDLTLDSDLKLAQDSDAIGLAGDDSDRTLSLAGDSATAGGSSLNLAGEFEDDDIVLGGSSNLGSDIDDSGIDLGAAIDSGLSLEEPPAELGSGDLSMEGEDQGTGSSSEDDAFLLTPTLELDEDSSDASGSQVIALDTDEPFDESAATMLGDAGPALLDEGMPADFGEGVGGMLGEDVAGMSTMLEEDVATGAAQPIAAVGAALPSGPPVVEAQYSLLNVLSLMLLFFVTALTGMMMYDMMRNMWSWDQPYPVNSTIMTALIDMIGW